MNALIIVYNGEIHHNLVDTISYQSNYPDKIILLMHRQSESVEEVLKSQFQSIENFDTMNIDTGFRYGTIATSFILNVCINDLIKEGFDKFVVTTSDCELGHRLFDSHIKMLDKCDMVTGKVRCAPTFEDYRVNIDEFRALSFFRWGANVYWDNIAMLRKANIVLKENFSISSKAVNIIEDAHEYWYRRRELFHFAYINENRGYVEHCALLLKLRGGTIGILGEEFCHVIKSSPIQSISGKYEDTIQDLLQKIVTKPVKAIF